MSFKFEMEENGKLPFRGVEVSRQQGKFVTIVYKKPTISGVYNHFDSLEWVSFTIYWQMF